MRGCGGGCAKVVEARRARARAQGARAAHRERVPRDCVVKGAMANQSADLSGTEEPVSPLATSVGWERREVRVRVRARA